MAEHIVTKDKSTRSRVCVTHTEHDFDAGEYIDLNFRYFDPNDTTKTQQQMRVFILDTLQRIYSKGIVTGDLLLDLGCGPVCFTPALASPCVKEFVLSDVSESNLDILRKWKTGENEYKRKIVSYIAEITDSRLPWQQVDRLLADKVTHIVRGDIRSANPLAGSDLEKTKFDVITVVLCLNAAAEDRHGYEQCVRNISTLLKPDGYILVADTQGKSTYTVGDCTFRVASLPRQTIQTIFMENGFDIQQWMEAPFREGNTDFRCFCMLARKTM